MLIITTPTEIFWYKIVSFYSALVIDMTGTMGDLVNSKNLCNPDLSDPEKKICDSKKNLDTAPPSPCLDSPRILDLGDINFLDSQNLCHPNLGSGGVLNLRGHPVTYAPLGVCYTVAFPLFADFR